MECVGCLPVARAVDVPRLLGLTPSQCRSAVARGDLHRLRRGVLVGACHVDRAADDARYLHLLRLRALLLEYDGAVAGYESAAIALGLPVLDVPDLPRLVRPRGAWRGGAAARVRVAALPAWHLATADGVACTSAARTVVDIARVSDLRAAAVVGDAAMRRGLSREVMAAVVEECSTWSDVRRARDAVGFLDERSESPFESASRATIRMYDVPTPQLQVPVQGASGVWYRVDFLWEKRRLVGEADGRSKYVGDARRSAEQVLFAEKQREDDLREAGFDFVRWSYGQMLGQPDVTAARILRKLR